MREGMSNDEINHLTPVARYPQLRSVLGALSLISLILTILWLVCLIAGTPPTGQPNTVTDLFSYLSDLNALFYLTYINAALITIVAIALFAALFLYIRLAAPVWSLIGMAFVPVYGCLNLVAYLSQITIVPELLRLRAMPDHQAFSEFLLQQVVQQWPHSAVFAFNNLAYALLGIPSIVFGVVILRTSFLLRTGAIPLGLSGVASILGFLGIVARNAWLAHGSLVGGVLFLLALIHFSWSLIWRKEKQGFELGAAVDR
jgi:hypothetical protein